MSAGCPTGCAPSARWRERTTGTRCGPRRRRRWISSAIGDDRRRSEAQRAGRVRRGLPPLGASAITHRGSATTASGRHLVEPCRTLSACADLAEKRHGPLLHELFTLTTANGKRMAVVEDLGGGKGSACMLHVEDAERIRGFPRGLDRTVLSPEPTGRSPAPGGGRRRRRLRREANVTVGHRGGPASVAVDRRAAGKPVRPQVRARWRRRQIHDALPRRSQRVRRGADPGVHPRRVRTVKDGKAGAVGTGSVKPAPVSDVVTEARWAALGARTRAGTCSTRPSCSAPRGMVTRRSVPSPASAGFVAGSEGASPTAPTVVAARFTFPSASSSVGSTGIVNRRAGARPRAPDQRRAR